MTGIRLGGGAGPRVRPGDYERALALITELGGDKKTRAYLAELVAASAVNEKARTEAEAAVAEAKERDATAREAEASARSQREALAAETMTADSRLTAERAELATERDRLEDLARDLDAKVLDLRLRESAIQRAFAAYNEGDRLHG